MARVWALEPYYGGSHRQFLDGLVRHSAHDFDLLTLPGRFWKWRMHGGALELAAQAARLVDGGAVAQAVRPAAGGATAQAAYLGDGGAGALAAPARGSDLPDVFFASDMLDLPVFLSTLGRSRVGRPEPALRGGAPYPAGLSGAAPGGACAAAAKIPAIVYFHENQLTYPLPLGVERDLDYGFKNLTTALAAQTVLFNSEYHRQEFLSAAGELIAGMPDAVPEWAVGEVAAKSSVLPVGCDLRALDEHRERGLEQAAAGRWGDADAGPLIVWNQRWEYDKAPYELFRVLIALRERGVAFRLALAGSGTGVPTAAFLRAKEVLADRVVQWGRLESRADYAGLLWAADVVPSTAIHEFFGISVIEAVYCGCRPVLPRRLSYPEIIPAEAHGDVLYGEGDFAEALTRALAAPHAWSEDWQRTWAARFDWGSLKTRYDGIIGETAQSGARTRV